MGCNLPAFIGDVPEYSVRDGRLYICLEGACFVMPIGIYLDSCERGKAAIVEWQRSQCGISNNVVAFTPR
jgi:hypothetical protein